MKDTVLMIGVILVVIAFGWGVYFMGSLFSNSATPIVLSQPKPGITCATVVTSTGAAIDCWKD